MCMNSYETKIMHFSLVVNVATHKHSKEVKIHC